MAGDPAEGLAIVAALADAPSLRDYPQVPAVRAHLLGLLGRTEEAREAYLVAADLTRNEPEAALLRRRAHESRELSREPIELGRCSVWADAPGRTRGHQPHALRPRSAAHGRPGWRRARRGRSPGPSGRGPHGLRRSTRRWRRVRLARPARTGLIPRTATKSATRTATKLRWPGPPRPGPRANPNRPLRRPVTTAQRGRRCRPRRRQHDLEMLAGGEPAKAQCSVGDDHHDQERDHGDHERDRPRRGSAPPEELEAVDADHREDPHAEHGHLDASRHHRYADGAQDPRSPRCEGAPGRTPTRRRCARTLRRSGRRAARTRWSCAACFPRSSGGTGPHDATLIPSCVARRLTSIPQNL